MPDKLAVENILGYSVVYSSKEDCVECAAEWIFNKALQKYFVCLNPHSYEVAHKDLAFRSALSNADIIVPDGIGIILASKILRGTLRTRITGYDIFEGVTSTLDDRGGFSCFFLGSTDDTLRKIQKKIEVEFPKVKVAGCYSPPFKQQFTEEDNRMMIDSINKVRPDVLWVGMTAPKQEKWINENKRQLTSVKFIGAIGAVFDFYAGTVKRSHPVFQQYGLEWLPRLLKQPGRLWKRNFISNPRFLLRVTGKRLKGG